MKVRRRPLVTAGIAGTVAGVALLAVMIRAESDLDLTGMLMFSGVLAFAVFTLVLVVLWLVDVVRGPDRDEQR